MQEEKAQEREAAEMAGSDAEKEELWDLALTEGPQFSREALP